MLLSEEQLMKGRQNWQQRRASGFVTMGRTNERGMLPR